MQPTTPIFDSDAVMIRIRGLHKRFGPNVVFNGLNLEVHAGETRVIIGGSGVGKSVLLKHLSGLLSPDAGTIEIAGRSVSRDDKESLRFLRRKIGMLFQGSALFDSMNVRENVGFNLDQCTGTPAEEIDARVREVLEMVNLPGVEHLYPASLSGGMQKRVALARALASQPAIMLYDEPTTGLDPINANVINRLIRDVQRRLRVTSLVVTHDMGSAFMVGDRISMFHEGVILETGAPDEIRASRNPIVSQFIQGSAEGPVVEEAGHAV
jgi:phospholipid/cholesterol/gamma-HCH transport system ATP-binding protein